MYFTLFFIIFVVFNNSVKQSNALNCYTAASSATVQVGSGTAALSNDCTSVTVGFVPVCKVKFKFKMYIYIYKVHLIQNDIVYLLIRIYDVVLN